MGKGDDPLGKLEPERRDFLKKIAVAAAFATPAIATFSLDGARKKAFAQAAYDAPEVVGFTSPGDGQAIVTFSQAMNTGVGADRSRFEPVPCRTTFFAPEGYFPHAWAWQGNTQQKLTFSGFCDYRMLHVTYNQGGCGDKFVGANGLELLPYSGELSVTVCA